MGTCVSKASSPLCVFSSLTPIIKIAWRSRERPSSEDFTNTLWSFEENIGLASASVGKLRLGQGGSLKKQPALPQAWLQHFKLLRRGSDSLWTSVRPRGLFTRPSGNECHSRLKDKTVSSTRLPRSSSPGRQIWAALYSQHN